MALTDHHDNNFVGRDYEIVSATNYFMTLFASDISMPPKFLSLNGKSGIGKTKLASVLVKILREKGLLTTQVIDLKSTSNRTLLSLFKSIATDLGTDSFSSFISVLEKYIRSTDYDRTILYSRALEEFITGIETVAQKTPVIIILDTIETIIGTRYLQSLLEIFQRFNGKCGFILAGQTPLNLKCKNKTYNLGGFLKDDIEKLASKMYKTRGKSLSLCSKVFDKLLLLTNGKPVLCALAIDWLMENESQVSYVLSLEVEFFENEIVKCIKSLNPSEVDMIECMAIITKRFTPAIAAHLNQSKENECAEIMRRLWRFSFIKCVPEEGHLSLHDEIVVLVRKSIPSSKTKLLVASVIEWYAAQDVSSLTESLKKVYVAEELHYRFTRDIVDGISLCDNQMQLAIECFDYDWWNLLFNEATFFAKSNKAVSKAIEVNRADMLLTQYRPLEAKMILEEVESTINKEIEMERHARVMEGYGNVIINPCTIEGADFFKAVEFFKESIEIYEKHQIVSRIPICLFELGKAYLCIGRNIDAEAVFTRALSISNDRQMYKLSAKILDEMGKMYRLQQRVEDSRQPLATSYELRKSTKDDKNLGVYYYYLANTLRDLDSFKEAEINYNIAEAYLLEINDSFKLCELYCDKSWMNCLSSQYREAEVLLEKSWEIAQKHNFGTEFSEYFHIKYEISIANSDYGAAYKYLDEALAYAKKYSNIYIILDCLNHAVQRSYAQKKYDEIPNIISEMESYESQGCGIKVFTGRAKMVLGDYHFDQNDFSKAYTLWVEGLVTVALYGNSRSNTEVFSDIFEARKERLEKVLCLLGDDCRRDLYDVWKTNHLVESFPNVFEVCNPLKG